jgi:hypothetical protein
MPPVPPLIFALNVVTSALVLRWFVWPRLSTLDRNAALVPLVAFHWIRTAGILAVYPGMTGAFHASDWAWHIAAGDLLTVVLAWIAVGLLRARQRAAIPVVWLFNVVGLLDIANAMRNAVATSVPVHTIGAQALVIAFGPPALVVSHIAIFVLLLRRPAGGGRFV